MSSRTPVRDDWSAPRDLIGLLVTRLSHGLPQAAPRPDHGPYLASRCYDVAPAPAGLKPNGDGNMWRKGPCRPRLTVMRRRRQTVDHLRLRFPPPSAAHGNGRPRACHALRAFRSFPEALGFLRQPLLQPANSQFEEYRNAFALHWWRTAFPRNPPDRTPPATLRPPARLWEERRFVPLDRRFSELYARLQVGGVQFHAACRSKSSIGLAGPCRYPRAAAPTGGWRGGARGASGARRRCLRARRRLAGHEKSRRRGDRRFQARKDQRAGCGIGRRRLRANECQPVVDHGAGSHWRRPGHGPEPGGGSGHPSQPFAHGPTHGRAFGRQRQRRAGH